jgi:hypothetical protein
VGWSCAAAETGINMLNANNVAPNKNNIFFTEISWYACGSRRTVISI